jgi:hypothetical protein
LLWRSCGWDWRAVMPPRRRLPLGQQDYSYLVGECMDLTLELSETKWPPAETLPELFQDNLDALLALPIATAFSGIKCVVCCSRSRVLPACQIRSLCWAGVRASRADRYRSQRDSACRLVKRPLGFLPS